MKSLKFWMVATLMTTFSLGTFSAVLSPQEALARASQNGKRKVTGISSDNLQLMYTQADATSQVACYVFSKPGVEGYMVLSADDLVPAVLGYSDTGSFDADAMPDAMKYWLGEYAKQIEWARKNAHEAPMKAVARPAREPISPLVKTKWNQNTPYNDNCPGRGDDHCMTGCVATAMAQVMKYHNWPEKGSGTNSYSWVDTTLEMDFGDTTFDWGNMRNTYSSYATEAERDAVATLMYACGISVNMNYGYNASGAYSYRIEPALETYFGYSEGLFSVKRNLFGMIDWENLIYENLRNCGPILYLGVGSVGHCFVCDGYSQDGYFHINWGWGGMSDGYFLLSALDPNSQGIGGGNSGFNSDQEAVLWIKKPAEAEEGNESYLLGFQEDWQLKSNNSNKVDAPIYIKTPICNYSSTIFNGEIGLKITSTKTGVTTYCPGSSFTNLAQYPFSYDYQYPFYYKDVYYDVSHFIIPSGTPDGYYRVTPVYRETDGEWKPMLMVPGDARNMTMKVSGSTVSFSLDKYVNTNFTDITLKSKICINRNFLVSTTIDNTSGKELYGKVTGVLIDSNDKIVAQGTTYPINILAGEKRDFDYYSTLSNYYGSTYDDIIAKKVVEQRRAIAAGNYKFAFVKGDPTDFTSSLITNHTLLSDKVDVQVEAEPESPTLTLSNFHFVDGNSSSVDPNNMDITAKVTCTAGYCSEPAYLYFYPYPEGGYAVGSLKSEAIFLSAGESSNISFKGSFAGQPGKTYIGHVHVGKQSLPGSIEFTIADVKTEIDSTPINNLIATVKVYTVAGIPVAKTTDGLAPGIYVVVTTYTDGTVKTTKIVK